MAGSSQVYCCDDDDGGGGGGTCVSCHSTSNLHMLSLQATGCRLHNSISVQDNDCWHWQATLQFTAHNSELQF